ncbi:cob(I)yrinic acid a,c-diamide adenosyltransferase [Patescibacteria group bacterium]|nr:cob(I)yrinic acid a,c-diamide adenosyltransferase [Patescibacteria group bacterium]
MPIYTRTGDFGETSLFGGKRVWKFDDIVDLYGLIDELNSFIGLIVSIVAVLEVQEFLREIQKDLFTMGSFFAGGNVRLHQIKNRVEEMEARIDKMDDTLPSLHQFILPGGTKLSSLIHIARSVARRVERKAVYVLKHCSDHPEIDTFDSAQTRRSVWLRLSSAECPTLSGVERVDKKQLEKIIQYLNRLSDFLFILARFVNRQENVVEMVWDGMKKENRV